MENTNEKYTITISEPLLRAGVTITIGPVNKRYAASAITDALEIVRKVNDIQNKLQSDK